MAFVKMHDWDPDPAADGPFPAESQRCAGLPRVRLSNEDGQWCGYEDDQGNLIPISRVTNSPAKQTEIDAAQVRVQQRSADMAALKLTLDALRAKRDAGTPFTAADAEVIYDLVLGRLP
jgi:hypothetical protein